MGRALIRQLTSKYGGHSISDNAPGRNGVLRYPPSEYTAESVGAGHETTKPHIPSF